MVKRYIPDQGDIVYLDFDPQAGRKQKGRRPGLDSKQNPLQQKSGACFCLSCNKHSKAISNTRRPDCRKEGEGFCHGRQMKSLNFGKRKIDFVEKADHNILDDVLARLSRFGGYKF